MKPLEETLAHKQITREMLQTPRAGGEVAPRARACVSVFVSAREDGKQSAAGAIMHNGGRNLHGGSFIINLAAPLGDSPVPWLTCIIQIHTAPARKTSPGRRSVSPSVS